MRRFTLAALLAISNLAAAEMPRIVVAPDANGFRLVGTEKTWTPWGFNYDRDDAGRLLEDYWQAEWETVASDFGEMQALGANVVRVHLQVARFLRSATEPDEANLRQLKRLLALAEQIGLYLDLTGLGCYHKADVPPWYDALDEAGRWAAQAKFWEAIAQTCAGSPSVFCYDLMNEPVVPPGRNEPGQWLGPPFAGKHFVQYISLDRANRSRPAIAKQWIEQLVAAIRRHDARTLVTVGLVDWSLDRPGLTSGFVPAEVAAPLDFVAVHLYPHTGKVEDDLATLAAFAAVGKPVVIEETAPLFAGIEEFEKFVTASRAHAAGWIGFYWGKPPEQLDATKLGDAFMRGWLDLFRRGAPK